MLDDPVCLGFPEEQITADVRVGRPEVARSLAIGGDYSFGDHADVVLGLHMADAEAQARETPGRDVRNAVGGAADLRGVSPNLAVRLRRGGRRDGDEAGGQETGGDAGADQVRGHGGPFPVDVPASLAMGAHVGGLAPAWRSRNATKRTSQRRTITTSHLSAVGGKPVSN